MRFPWQAPEPLTVPEITKEFIDCLHSMHPKAVIGKSDNRVVHLTIDGTELTIVLHKAIADVEALNEATPKSRQEIYRRFITAAFASIGASFDGALTPEDRGRIVPRLLYPTFLEYMNEHEPGVKIPHRPFYDSGMILLYVIEMGDRVKYITQTEIELLGLGESSLHQVAMENARQLYPATQLRKCLEAKEKFMGEVCPDGNNSTRLVVLAEYLKSDEQIAVMLPGSEDFIWGPPPKDNNWKPLQHIASQGQPSYIGYPLLVTAGNVQPM